MRPKSIAVLYMYRRAFGVLRQHSMLFLCATAVIAITEQILSPLLNLVFQTAFCGFLAFICHKAILTGEPQTFEKLTALHGPNASSFIPFIWRYLLLSALLFASFLSAAAILASTLDPDLWVFGYWTAIGAPLALSTLLLSLIGTILPAAALNKDASVGRSLARGKLTFISTLWHLLSGVGVFVTADLAMIFLAGSGHILPQTNQPVATQLWFVLNSFTNCCAVLLAATALSMAYQQAEVRLGQADEV